MTFYTEGGDSVLFEQAAFLDNSQKLIALYQELGIKQVPFSIESNVQLSAKLSLVSVIWHFNSADGEQVYQATTRYLMRDTGAGLKIKAVIVVDETSKIQQLKAI